MCGLTTPRRNAAVRGISPSFASNVTIPLAFVQWIWNCRGGGGGGGGRSRSLSIVVSAEGMESSSLLGGDE